MTTFMPQPASMRAMRRFAAALAVLCCALFATNRGHAQTLDLGGVAQGPTLTAVNGANDLGDVLEAEATALRGEAARLTAEAQAAALARAHLRALAAFLLHNGSGRPWSESAPVVAGMRVAGVINRCDALIDAASRGRNSRDGSALDNDEARAAVVELQRMASMTLDHVRRAAAVEAAHMPAALNEALAQTLAPLAQLVRIVEGTSIDDAKIADPWPMSPLGPERQERRDATRATAQSLRTKAAALPAAFGQENVIKALTTIEARSGASTTAVDLRLIEHAIDALEFLNDVATRKGPPVMPLVAVNRALARLLHAVDELSLPANALATEPRQQLAALGTTSRVATMLVAMRSDDGVTDADRAQLSDACSALLGAELSGDERARARVAMRIETACLAAERLTQSARSEPPRDLKDVVRTLDRSAKGAVKALPATFARMAADPVASADPALMSALERVSALDADRARVASLQLLIDSLTGVRPKAGRAFAQHAKRSARMLLDPLKRSSAQVAFASLEAQVAQTLPFPYEEELKRKTDRALKLTGGEPAKLIEIAGAARAAWADALGRGDFGGAPSQHVDRIARLFACLRDLDPLGESVTREEGDELALWGGWASRRAVLAPAALDLSARSALACSSMLRLASVGGDDRAAMEQFERDVDALERAIPLVRLVSQLDRAVVGLLPTPVDSLAQLLAPLVIAPAPDAYLVRELTRLHTINRALFESEFARRKGNVSMREALATYLALLSRDVSQSAFGARPKIVTVPGFDGTQDDASGGKQEGADSTTSPRESSKGSDSRSSTPKSNDSKSSDSKSSDSRSNTPKSNDAKSSDAKSSGSKSNTPKSNDAQSSDSKDSNSKDSGSKSNASKINGSGKSGAPK